MFKSRTLFIIGAGGSKEVGLPIGDELKTDISTRMDFRFSPRAEMDGEGDFAIYQTLGHHFRQELNDYLRACRKIRNGMVLTRSIDNFIDTHRNDSMVQLCGKMAIIRSIIQSERDSKLFVDPSGAGGEVGIDFRAIQDSYFVQLWYILQDGVSTSEVEMLFKNTTFITFNYDRCLEHFLFHALQQLYTVPANVAAQIISKVPIIHAYGAVGRLPWCGQQEAVPFGGEDPRYSSIDLLRRSDEIQTYTERLDDSDELREMHALVNGAEDVIFLGFSYYRENMELLTPRGGREPQASRIFGTAYGLSTADVNVVNERIQELYPACDRVQIDNLTCGALFREYGLALTQ